MTKDSKTEDKFIHRGGTTQLRRVASDVIKKKRSELRHIIEKTKI